MSKLLKSKFKLKARDDKEYKVEIIYNSKINTNKIVNKLLNLYYRISWKDYREIKNT